MRAAFWLLVGMAVLGTTFVPAWVRAQAGNPAQVAAPTVIRGNDIGFRIDGQNGDRATGRLVIWNGAKWVETEFSVAPRPATSGGR